MDVIDIVVASTLLVLIVVPTQGTIQRNPWYVAPGRDSDTISTHELTGALPTSALTAVQDSARDLQPGRRPRRR